MSHNSGNGDSNGAWARLPADPACGAERVELADGKEVYEAGESAQRLFFIHAGQVRIYEKGPDHADRLLEILGPGDWFGEEALATKQAYSSQAVVVSAAVLWAVPVDRLMEVLCGEPILAGELIHQLASRLQAARAEASRFVFDDCSARLVKTLLRFSDTAAATHEADGSVVLRITHRQLAQAVGAARETVSLALTELRQQSLVRTGRNRLIFSPVRLMAFSKNCQAKTEHDSLLA